MAKSAPRVVPRKAALESGIPDARRTRRVTVVKLRDLCVRRTQLVLVAVLLGLVGLGLLLSAGFRDGVATGLGIMARGDVEAVRAYILSFGLWAPVISTGLMILQAIVSPLPAFVLTFANGLAYGTLWGGLLSVFGTTLASAVCFGLARLLGRRAVEAMVGCGHLQSADRWFARWGTHAVLAARLMPFMSVDLISYAAGLTSIRLRPFLVATLIGIIPSTFLYSYLGERASRYVVVLLVVNVLIILTTLVLAWVRRRSRRRTS